MDDTARLGMARGYPAPPCLQAHPEGPATSQLSIPGLPRLGWITAQAGVAEQADAPGLGPGPFGGGGSNPLARTRDVEGRRDNRWARPQGALEKPPDPSRDHP